MKSGGELASRTLLITDIPKHQCNVEGLTEYFKYVLMNSISQIIELNQKIFINLYCTLQNCREAFPTLSVEDVTLAYDIKELTELDADRDCAEQARLYCENYNRRKGPLKMYPQYCGQVIGCCFKQVITSSRFNH